MIVSRRLSKVGWTGWHLLATAVITLLAMAVSWQGWAQILNLGLNRETAGHIFLVPVVVIWLAWVRRRRMQLCRPRGPWVGLAIAMVGAMCYVYGMKRSVPMVFHLGTVMMPVGAALAVLGRDVFWSYRPAIFALLALVPLPVVWCEAVSFPLQMLVGQITCFVYGLFGVDARLDNDVLVMGNVRLWLGNVVGALPMIFVLALVSYGFVFGTPLRTAVRVMVLLLSPVFAIAGSTLALILTCWVYGNTSIALADIWHQVGEWVMLLIAFSLLVGVIRMLTWASVPIRQYTLAYDQ